MNLAIDIGNTLTKMAVVDKGQVVDIFKFEDVTPEHISSIFESYPAIDAAIMISSRSGETFIKECVGGRVRRFVEFDYSVATPLVNQYKTPQTLGRDRLAAAVGANALFPNNNVLVVDFGTAITIDVVSSKGEYLGGNISPGASSRFRALNKFTGKLPLCTLEQQVELIGQTTQSAIANGVANGIVYEIEGYIERFLEKYDDLKIIFTGGDGNFFAKRLKNTIFVTYDLVAYGLNRILEYNEQ